MNFIPVAKELPRYEERVVVRVVGDFFFTAVLERDEDGEYWLYDLSSGITTNSGEVTEEVISWAYIKE
jgi:hypothetical protein